MTLPGWSLPLIVAALALPIVVGFSLGGPGLGLAIGAIGVLVLVVIAARARPRERIEAAARPDDRRRILVVTTQDLEDPATTERIAESARLGDGVEPAEVVVLVPAQSGFLDRWASDERTARADAQRRLVLAAAALGKAHIDVRARVGDADVVLAVEDELRTFPATDVILVTGPPEDDSAGERAAAELGDRLGTPLTHLTVG